MLHFRIYVKYVNQHCNLHVIELGDCSVINIINDAKKELFGFSSIKFELEAMPIEIEFLDEPFGLLQYNVGPLDPIVDDVEMVDLDLNNDHGIPRPNDVELGDSDTDFQPDGVLSEDSYVSLVYDDIDGDHPVEQYDLDGDLIARYCAQNQWVPNDDGSIEFCLGKILGNVKLVRETVKKYAIQEEFRLKRIMNDRHRFIAMCNNEASTSEWIASSMGSKILANPNIKSKVLKNELLDKFAIRCGSQTIYRAKKKVLNNMKADHIKSYTRIENYVREEHCCKDYFTTLFLNHIDKK
ncbi:hypothetical protein ACOSQ4_002953 [Xanthoceras sorbifolium]